MLIREGEQQLEALKRQLTEAQARLAAAHPHNRADGSSDATTPTHASSSG